MVSRSPVETTIGAVLVAVISLAPVFIFYGFEPLVHLVDPDSVLALTFVATLGLSWFFATLSGVDRAEYLVVWLVVPLVAVFVVRVVFFPWWGAGPYPINVHPFVVMAAGILGAVVEFGAAFLAARHAEELAPIVEHKAVIILVILLVPVALVGFVYATPETATITGVDPVFSCGPGDAYPDRVGDRECPYGLSHTFAIGLEPSGDPLRVVVETPAGTENERWFSGGQMDRETATVFLSAHTVTVESPDPGPYTVRVESVWGEVLDEWTLEIESRSDARISDVEVGEDRTTVDVTVEYTGDFWIELNPRTVFHSDVALEFDERFVFDGSGAQTVRATVVDQDGNPKTLEPGTREIDLSFERIGVRSVATFDVEA